MFNVYNIREHQQFEGATGVCTADSMLAVQASNEILALFWHTSISLSILLFSYRGKK